MSRRNRRGQAMLDQLMETFRKASESSVQMQQDLFRHWAQQWASTPGAAAPSNEAAKNLQRRWIELLDKQRESLDVACKAGIRMIEQSFRTSDAKSPEDHRRLVEDLWRTLFETFKA